MGPVEGTRNAAHGDMGTSSDSAGCYRIPFEAAPDDARHRPLLIGWSAEARQAMSQRRASEAAHRPTSGAQDLSENRCLADLDVLGSGEQRHPVVGGHEPQVPQRRRPLTVF